MLDIAAKKNISAGAFGAQSVWGLSDQEIDQMLVIATDFERRPLTMSCDLDAVEKAGGLLRRAACEIDRLQHGLHWLRDRHKDRLMRAKIDALLPPTIGSRSTT